MHRCAHRVVYSLLHQSQSSTAAAHSSSGGAASGTSTYLPSRLLASDSTTIRRSSSISSRAHVSSANSTSTAKSNAIRRSLATAAANEQQILNVKVESKRPKSADDSSASNLDDAMKKNEANPGRLETYPPSEGRVHDLLQRYENIIGLTAVRVAQQNTVEMERQFLNAQDARRVRQDDLKRVQMRLKEIHAELDKTSRGEDRYLYLLTEEHKQIKLERQLLEEVQLLEHDERIKFQGLSSYLRESHEKERERAERTKYWSIIGSIVGALIGITGTTINNRMKMRDLRSIVSDSSDPVKVGAVLGELSQLVTAQQQQVRAFMTDVRGMISSEHPPESVSLAAAAATGEIANDSAAIEDNSAILDAIRQQEQRLETEMADLKRMVAAEHGYQQADSDANTLVYVGPEVSTMLAETAADLEAKLKVQTVMAVCAVYASLALVIPIVFLLAGSR